MPLSFLFTLSSISIALDQTHSHSLSGLAVFWGILGLLLGTLAADFGDIWATGAEAVGNFREKVGADGIYCILVMFV